MSEAIPSLAERNRRIVALAKKGLSPARIEPHFEGVSRNTITQVLCVARAFDPEIPLFSTSGERRDAAPSKFRGSNLPAFMSEAFAEPARRRGISVQELAFHLLRIIADENMVDAILDDAETLS